jgi:cyclic pyranopterin monophosphate synthase
MKLSYAFEELTDDLPRPPKSAIRAMFASGVLVSPRGWKTLPGETRQAVALEGTRDVVNVAMVAELLKGTPPSHIRLVSKVTDPGPDEIPTSLVKVLGPRRTLTLADWRSLRPLDRYVIASLVTNTRLLWRALDEMANRPGASMGMAIAQPWSGVLAHCEVQMRPETLERLMSPKYLEGRGCVLARVAGIRAARRIAETMDLQAESGTGPAELDWGLAREPGTILWQAHVSSWDGEFFPTASLLAASTAAVAVYDMARELDSNLNIGPVSLVEEPWMVGIEREESTGAYVAKAAEIHGSGSAMPAQHSAAWSSIAAELQAQQQPPPASASIATFAATPIATVKVSRQESAPIAPPSSVVSVSKKSLALWLVLMIVAATLVSTLVAVLIVRFAAH